MRALGIEAISSWPGLMRWLCLAGHIALALLEVALRSRFWHRAIRCRVICSARQGGCCRDLTTTRRSVVCMADLAPRPDRPGDGYWLGTRASVRTVTSSGVVARRSAQACHSMNANPAALITMSEYSSRPVLFTA
jgi:hypothetical protein